MAEDVALLTSRFSSIIAGIFRKLTNARRIRFFGRKTLLVASVTLCVLCVARPQILLVVDRPKPSDAVVVLSGAFYTRFPAALNLLHHGAAQRLIIDADDRHTTYGETQADRSLEVAHAQDPSLTTISICRLDADSTLEEASELDSCLKAIHAKSVLVVTSPYHTRRALSIVRNQLPGYQWSVAAARDESTTAEDSLGNAVREFAKLAWWDGVDRWKSHSKEQDTNARAAK